LRAAEAPAEASGEVFNIACGEKITVNDLVRELNMLMGVSREPVYAEPRPGDIKHSFADISKARRVLAFDPGVNFKQGLRKTVAWYKKRR
jgi:UDP-N-acetylglucosamine 4-epimerase